MILNMSTGCPDDVEWGADLAALEAEWLATPAEDGDEGEGEEEEGPCRNACCPGVDGFCPVCARLRGIY